MGRKRGQRNRDNDRFTAERRDRAQSGMVAAPPIEVTMAGEFIAMCALGDVQQRIEPSSQALVAAVRQIVSKRPDDWKAPVATQCHQVKAPTFHEDLFRAARQMPRRPVLTIGTQTRIGEIVRDPIGGVREVVAVVNAGALRSYSTWWLWNPERAFRFLHGELFDSYRVPVGRWRERQWPRYAEVYMSVLLSGAEGTR